MMHERILKMDIAWARDFACAPDALHGTVSLVQPHAGAMQGYEGIWMLATDGSPCISVPPDMYPAISEAARTWLAVDEYVLPRIL